MSDKRDWSDTTAIFAYCREDESALMSIEAQWSEFWLPWRKIYKGSSWVAADIIIDIFGIHMPVARLLRLVKVWVPSKHSRFITNAYFEVLVPLDVKRKIKAPLGKYRPKIQWMCLADVHKLYGLNQVKSPEIFDLFALARSPHANPQTTAPDYFVSFNYMEVIQPIIVSTKTTPDTLLILSAGLDREIQEGIYTVFISLTTPALYMSLETFCQYASPIGWPKEELKFLFYSADVTSRGALSYREFLTFIAATEPNSGGVAMSTELRTKYIFRFYDRECKNHLRKEDLRAMFVHMRKPKNGGPIDAVRIEKELVECYKMMKIPETQTITLNQFLQNVVDLKIRGTSQIYRTPISIRKFITEWFRRRGPNEGTFGNTNGQMDKVNFEIGHYCLTVKDSKTLISDPISAIKDTLSKTTNPIQFGTEQDRKKSDDYFNIKYLANDILRQLRILIKNNSRMGAYTKVDNLVYVWPPIDTGVFAGCLRQICEKVREIFCNEPRLLEVNSPAYIMGDLHGNINDLLQFEGCLWRYGPGLCPANLLFLGDYVDRGIYSVEVITYLFAHKLLIPKKLFLVRGNHELRRVQQMWTFEAECKLKFGDKLGLMMFESINSAFDMLPVAARVDNRVFCCHGGIPPPWLCPTVIAINDIPILLPNPQEQSSLAWELLWNDPVRAANINDNVTMELLANEGFAENTRRGTGHVFSVEALEKFLTTNSLTHLIRAHEVAEAGFNLQQNGKMFTIFSTSKYCCGGNQAACIIAEQGKLRVIRLYSD